MSNTEKFYINSQWVEPRGSERLDVINPATEEPCGRIAMGTAEDVDAAVAAAVAAFPSYSTTTREERVELLKAIVAAYQARYNDVAATISQEMGAPMSLAINAQAAAGMAHFQSMVAITEQYPFESVEGETALLREPVGVCGFITPWNWPVNQIATKVAPALAAGCTMVLKPSEVAPLNAHLLAEILDAAGVPAGVFNLVDGDGPTVGEALSRHPGIDMMSFTGSTRAGKIVAKVAADTVKRVTQELGGKSANIILDDADFEQAVVQAACAAASTTAARAATPPPACWCRPTATTKWWPSPRPPPRKCRWAVRPRRAPTSARWCPRCSTTASRT